MPKDNIARSILNTVIDDATFSQSVNSADLSLDKYRIFGVTLRIGAKTGSPTIQAKIQVKDSNGNYIDYYVLPTLSTGNESQAEALYDVPFPTIRFALVFGGSGSFANVTAEIRRMK